MKTDELLHCEEQLRTTLHSDDKEKLRRKLAQLRKEYLRTAQRLQRAERLDAVRSHVRSRISEQKRTDPEVRSETASLLLKSSDGDVPRVPDYLEPHEHSADVDNPKKSQTIRFMLPSDAACPQTPDPSPVTQSGGRPSSALRLRSRRSRLRLERRSVGVGRSTDNIVKRQDLSDRVDHDGTAGEDEDDKVNPEGVDIMHESEELFSSAESESPSLLLTHWNIHGQTDTENVGRTMHQEKETHLRSDQKNKSDSPSSLLTCGSPLIHPPEKRNDTPENRSREEVERKEEDANFRRASHSKLDQENYQEAAKKTKSTQNPGDFLTIKEEPNQITGDEKASTLQESCTIVDGLLFPAEYYVRTTRRMSSSQTQPDMQAIILSQLNPRRHHRSRGRGRGQSKNIAEPSAWHNQTDLPCHKTASPSDESLNATVQRSGEKFDSVSYSQINTEAVLSPSFTGAPARGRRKRGRGRGKPRTQRSPCSPNSISQCPSADGTKLCVTQKDTFLVPEEADPAPSHSTDSQLSFAVNETQSTSGSEQMQKVFPIFMKSGIKTAQSPQKNRGPTSWQSLLLPSSSPTPTYLSPLLPVKGLSTLSTQDFHLPDEQFASLKLQKLRSVAVELGIEHFSAPSRNTRSSYRLFSPHCFSVDDLMTPLPLPLSPTPTASNLRCDEDHQAATLSANLKNVSTEHKHRDELMNQSSTDEDTTENLQEEIHSNTFCSVSGVQVRAGGDCLPTHREDKTLALCGKSLSCTQTDEEAPLKSDQAIYCGEGQYSVNTQVEEDFSSDWPKEPSNTSACLQTTGSPGESPVSRLNVKYPVEVSKQPSLAEQKPAVNTQLLLSSPPASAPCHFITPHLPSSTLISSPELPSLGITPRPDAIIFPLTSSPSALPLCSPPLPPLPPPPPPPPPLSQCPSISHSGVELQASGGRAGPTTKEAAEEVFKTHISHTLKAAAGGSLLDACCFIGPSGTLFVAAAGKWAVCLWSQTSASDWILKHTWTFNKPVVNVFPVPDAAGLMCVTLGQLEIREVRMLSSSSLTQKLTCEGVLQAVIGLSGSRVVTSSPSATGSILQVFTLSDSSSSSSSHSLASPGVCVGALARVDGLSDALIGTDESGNLFVWNLKSGQLLCRVAFGEDLSHTACLRGYSHSGVLFVLLQHHFLSSLEKEEEKKALKNEAKDAFFSLVAVNPLTGKSVLAARLYPPAAWTDSLCEADVNCTGVVGLSQSGCVCVWGLGGRGAPRILEAPESDGWQLARWGGADTLVTGNLNGDVTLHRCN